MAGHKTQALIKSLKRVQTRKKAPRVIHKHPHIHFVMNERRKMSTFSASKQIDHSLLHLLATTNTNTYTYTHV